MGYEKVIESNKRRAKHNMHKSRVYQIWASMKHRCANPNNCRYGGRGITVCRAWQKFETFYADMGDPPTNKHTLERVNNNRGYMPSNCKWATRKEQSRNRSSNTWVTFNGARRTWAGWAEHLGVTYQMLMNRRARGGSIAQILRPRINTKRNELIEFDGAKHALREWAAMSGVKYQTLYARLHKGSPLF